MQTSPVPLSAAAMATSGRGGDATSFVAWSAIVAGAVTMAAISLILLLLGSGLGLASVSPWARVGVSAVTFTAGTAIWLIMMQWIACGFGGYLTGRLRHRWTNMHADEVFFRDTAHGFLAWVLATIFTAAFLASTVAAIVGGGTAMIGASRSADTKSMEASGPMSSFVDTLYRPAASTPAANTASNDLRAETARLLINDMKDGDVPDADRKYLGRMVAARTGLSAADAAARVDDVVTQLKSPTAKLQQDADSARKAASAISFYSFLSLLIGAFIAATAAALGGHHRDDY